MFLLRLAFWLTLVLLILPMPDQGAQPADAALSADQQASVVDALGVAQAAVSDVAGFCVRNPETCSTGVELAGTLREKAKYGAQLVYEYLAEEPVDAPLRGTGEVAMPVEPVAPVEAVPAADMAAPAPSTVDTLSAEDRDTAWRGAIDG